MAHLRDLEALLRNTNLQSPCASDAKRITEVILHVRLTCNQSRRLQQSPWCPPTVHPPLPSMQPRSYILSYKLFLLLSDPPLGFPACRVNICLRTPNHRGGRDASLSWIRKRQGGSSGGCSRWWRGALNGWSGAGAEVKNNDSFWRKGL